MIHKIIFRYMLIDVTYDIVLCIIDKRMTFICTKCHEKYCCNISETMV